MRSSSRAIASSPPRCGRTRRSRCGRWAPTAASPTRSRSRERGSGSLVQFGRAMNIRPVPARAPRRTPGFAAVSSIPAVGSDDARTRGQGSCLMSMRSGAASRAHLRRRAPGRAATRIRRPTMPTVKTLHELFMNELQRLYGAEQQLEKALPSFARAASSTQLKQALHTHFEETETHVERLEQVFGLFGEKVDWESCDAMKAILEEGEECIELDADAAVRDAGLIAAVQEAEHFEIAAYGTLRTWAATLKRQDAVHALEWTLEEEKNADRRLTEIAASLNTQAAAVHAP